MRQGELQFALIKINHLYSDLTSEATKTVRPELVEG